MTALPLPATPGVGSVKFTKGLGISDVLLLVTVTETFSSVASVSDSNGPASMPVRLIICGAALSKMLRTAGGAFTRGASLIGFTMTLNVRDVETLSAMVFGAVTNAPAV